MNSKPNVLSSIDFFKKLNVDSLNLVAEFYDEKATFLDPLGQHQGVESIKEYYHRLYKYVTYMYKGLEVI